MDELKELLLAAGFPAATLDVLAAEEKPEDYDKAKVIKEAVEGREKFYLTKLTPKIENEYEERTKGDKYAAIVKPIQNRLERLAKEVGATPEELKDLDAKALIKVIEAKQSDAIAAAAQTSDEELRKQVNALRGELSTVTEEKTAMDAQHQQDIENIKAETAKDRKREKISALVTRELASEAFKGIKDIGKLDRVMAIHMEDAGYSLDLDDEGHLKPVMLKDGTDAINFERNATFTSATDMMLEVARRGKLLRTHNGDDDAPAPGAGGKVTGSGKQFNSSVAFLEKSMNMQ